MTRTWYNAWHRVGTEYHLEVTYGGAFRYFSFILLLTFYCQTAMTSLPNTFKSQSLHAPSGLKWDVIFLALDLMFCVIPPSPAGFRRSMRLCRRKSHLSQVRAGAWCANSCCSAVGTPYEEVMRYQRRPSDKHRLIVLVGTSGRAVSRLMIAKFSIS